MEQTIKCFNEDTTMLLKSGELKENQYLKIIDLVELFHIRWGVCGQSTSKLNDI